jgi:CDP-glycerol glycerophosphotransferase (TagB/SpsB family)
LIRPGRYETGVYAKLDWMQLANGAAPRLFPNDRKTVLYAPHFERDDTSWFAVGHQVLDYFAAGSRFNLIFAPHVRLFDPPLPAKYRDFQRYLDVPHMLIDLGSERCVDMTYTRAADLYLGDVSSQVVEFLALPRPCVFFNTHRRDWQKDLSYRFWRNGLVIDSADDLERHLTHAFESHGDFLEEQRQYVSDTFGAYPVPPAMASRGADAIVSFLQNRNQSSPPA